MRITVGMTLLLGLLAAVGPISTDIYLPAFSLIDREFGRVGAAQITLAAWFSGLAFGQMLQGALSDRVGRRAPLLVGTLCYSLASIGCALAPGLVSFSVCRILAAVSGSASMVIPRALVRDVSEGMTAARLMSRLTLVLGVVPILAPALGGLLMTITSWRALFWGAGIYGLVCTGLVWRFLPDTLPPEMRLRQNLTQALARYAHIGREPLFVTNALMASCTFAGLFAYIGGSASVYTQYFHLSPARYGVLFGINASGYIAASQCAARLASRFGIDAVLHGAARLLLLFLSVAALDAVLHLGGVGGIIVPMFGGQAMIGVMVPLMTVNALTRHSFQAGSASALLGTWQFTLGALAGVLVALTANGTAVPMTLLMVAFATLVVVMDWLRPASIIRT